MSSSRQGANSRTTMTEDPGGHAIAGPGPQSARFRSPTSSPMNAGVFRNRSLKGWEARRKRAAREARALESTSASRFEGELSNDDDILDELIDPSFTIPSQDLPSDDLLRAIQAHAARLYASMGLLHPSTTALTKKKSQSHGDVVVSSAVASQGRTAKRYESTGSQAIQRAQSGSGSRSGSEYEEDPDQNGTTSDELAVNPSKSAGNGQIAKHETHGGKRKRGGQRGKRKQRDMTLALDGSALLAIGILVQKHIEHQLTNAGYTRLDAEQPPRDQGGIAGYELSDDESVAD